LEAYAIWKDSGGEPAKSLRERIRFWKEVRLAGAAFLREVAGKQSTRFANLLRRAAERYESEASVWEEGLALNDNNRPVGTILEIVHKAGKLAEEAALMIGEAALMGLKLPIALGAALLEAPAEPLPGATLNEIVYLARAGARPLRELAARRLGGTANPAGRSALIQLLYDSDGRTAETALYGLLFEPHPNLAPTLESAIRNGERKRTNLDFPFSWSLLAAYVDVSGSGALDALQEFRDTLDSETTDGNLPGDIDVFRALLGR